MQVLIAVNTPGDVAAGLLAGQRHGGASTPAVRASIEHARARPDRPVVHPNDTHHGSERESLPPKRHDGAFDATSSDEAVRRWGIAAVVPVGRRTRRCVRPTAHGAFVRGLRVALPSRSDPSRTGCNREGGSSPKGVAEGDAGCVLDGVDQATALDDPRRGYGATITAGAALTGAGADRAEVAQ